MPCKITSECISCGDCKPPCPTGAIYGGPEMYVIDQNICNDCYGVHKAPYCMDVCQVEGAIVYVPPQQ